MRNKKKNKYLLLLILLLGITLGYAAISTTLKITGIANVNKNTWSVYWDEESIEVTPGSVNGTAGVSDDGTVENAQLTWTADLDLPGDFYEFTIDAVNAGSIDAMITNITPTIPQDLASYINYSVTYADGIEPAVNHKLLKKQYTYWKPYPNLWTPTTEKYKKRVEFDSNATVDDLDDIGENGDSYTFGYSVTYGQATDDAIQKQTRFQTDTWDQIAVEGSRAATQTTITDGQCGVYHVGDTRDVDLGELGIHKLQILNCSTPTVCSEEGFSQSACGLVIGFADIVTSHRVNGIIPNQNGNGTKGGWEYSDIRAYLNNGTYSNNADLAGLDFMLETYDYTNTGFLNYIPNELKSKIINTTVVSGHGTRDSSNFTTIDKVYLFGIKELAGNWRNFNESNEDSAKEKQRQLDYYYDILISWTKGPIYEDFLCKDYPTCSEFWTRSPCSDDSNFYASQFGNRGIEEEAREALGISPAFRIAQ